jgi:predicted ester cyclase
MSAQENKDLIRRYIQAVDSNDSDDWSVIDEYIAEDFVAHNPPFPGVTLDRDGMKQASEISRVATPGRHEITMQVAEGDLVVSQILGRGVHKGDLLGIPATNKDVETMRVIQGTETLCKVYPVRRCGTIKDGPFAKGLSYHT